jgi:hypothetical protein
VTPPGAEGDEEEVALPPAVDVPAQAEALPIPIVPPAAAVVPIAAIPPPLNVPVELDTPDIPAAAHGMVVVAIEPLDSIGLRPAVPSSVAPRGIPAGPNDPLPCRPNGEVGSTLGNAADGICAKAALPLRRAADVRAINKRRPVGCTRHRAHRPEQRGSTETKLACMMDAPYQGFSSPPGWSSQFGRCHPGSTGDEPPPPMLCAMHERAVLELRRFVSHCSIPRLERAWLAWLLLKYALQIAVTFFERKGRLIAQATKNTLSGTRWKPRRIIRRKSSEALSLAETSTPPQSFAHHPRERTEAGLLA